MSIRRYTSSTGKKGWRVDVSRVIDGRKVRRTAVVYGARGIADRVERRLLDRLAAIQAGMVEVSEPTLGEVIDGWLAYADLTKRSSKTDHYRSVAILEYFGSERRARSITHDDVVRYVAKRRKQKSKHGRLLSPSTVDRELALLRAAYNHACRNQKLIPPYNPAQWVRPANVPNRRERIITDTEFLQILESLKPIHRLIFIVARFTGLRKSHLLSLRWEQLHDGLIYPPGFDAKKALYASSKRFGLPPLPPSLLRALQATSRKRKGYIFIVGKRRIGDVRSVMNRVRRDADIDFWFHDLRRSYATMLRRLGVDEYTAKTILGHAAEGTGNQVHDRYQTITADEVRQVGGMIEEDKLFKKIIEK